MHFWIFPFNIFEPRLTAGNWNRGKEKLQIGGTTVMFKIFRYKNLKRHFPKIKYESNNNKYAEDCQRLALAWRKCLASNKPKLPKTRTWLLLINKPLWKAYNLQGIVLGATGDKKMNEIVPACKGLTIWKTELSQMAELSKPS